MAHFADNFDPFRMDVVYGRTETRADYMEDYFESPQCAMLQKLNQRKFSIYSEGYYINDYNKVITKGDLSTPTQPKLYSNSKMLAHYKLCLEKSRFAPAISAQKTWKSYAKGDNTVVANTEQTPEEWVALLEVLAIRRACKFGIEYISNLGEARVHYALDGIDIQQVVGSSTRNLWTGKTGVPITTTELRYLFREWGRYRYSPKLIFYSKQDEVPAPWLDDSGPWLPYAIQRVAKYRNLDPKPSEGQLRNFDKCVQLNDAKQALAWFHDMKIGLN